MAALRAVVQLAAVAGVLAAVVGSVLASLGFVAVMHVVASGTAGRRLVRSRCGWWCALPVTAGPLPVVVLLLALGVVPLEGVALVPVAGILVGGAMTATVLAGRRGLDDLESRRGEVEAARTLLGGASPVQAGAVQLLVLLALLLVAAAQDARSRTTATAPDRQVEGRCGRCGG